MDIAINLLNVLVLHAIFIFTPFLYLWKADRLKRKKIISLLGLTPLSFSRKTAWRTAVLLGQLLVALAVLIVLFTALGLNDLAKVENVLKGMDGGMMIYYLIIGTFAEEIFFRGFLTTKLGVPISAIVFGVFHFNYFSVLEIVGSLILGYILCRAFDQNKSLWPNYLAHMAYNAIVLITIYRVF